MSQADPGFFEEPRTITPITLSYFDREADGDWAVTTIVTLKDEGEIDMPDDCVHPWAFDYPERIGVDALRPFGDGIHSIVYQGVADLARLFSRPDCLIPSFSPEDVENFIWEFEITCCLSRVTYKVEIEDKHGFFDWQRILPDVRKRYCLVDGMPVSRGVLEHLLGWC